MEKRLPVALQSVQEQTYPHLEILVVDDGSEWEISPADLHNSASIPVKLLKISHSGKPTAVNRGLQIATGGYFVILDADDELPRDSIEKRLMVLKTHYAELCIGGFYVHYQSAFADYRTVKAGSRQKLIHHLLSCVKSPVHQNCMMFSRSLLQKTGMMNPHFIRSQDKDYAIRLLRHSRKTVLIREPVYIYNRYYRPVGIRMRNRWMGMKFKLLIITQNSRGWRLMAYLIWGIAVETAKLLYFLCSSRY